MRLGLKLSPGALMLIVLGCAPPVLPGPHFSGTLAGRVTFDRVKVARNAMYPDQSVLDYENKEKWPVRETSIQVLSSSGSVVVEGFTDTDGNYCFSIEVDGPVKLRVKSVTRTPQVKVVDNTHGDALYALDSEAFAPNGRRFDMNAGCGWVGSNTGGNYSKARAAAPFAILDTIYTEEHAFLRDRPKINFGPLTVHWSPSNDSAMGTIESGHIGTSYFLDGSGLYLLGKEDSDTDEFDDHVIAHEWGHYFEATQSRSDSLGGGHGGEECLDARVAFGEGWGSALSGIALDNPYYLDTMWYQDSFGRPQPRTGVYLDLEGGPDNVMGFYSETSVQQILYDLWDSVNDGADQVSLGLGNIYDVMHGPQKATSALTSIYSFLKGLKDANPSVATQIDALSLAKGIRCLDEWGTGELFAVNSDQSQTTPDQLLYINGNTTSAFEVKFSGLNDSGENKLVQNRYVRLTGNGNNVVIAASSTTSVPIMMIVYQSGKMINYSFPDATLPKTLSFASVLNQDYVVTLQDNNILGTTDIITLRITK